MKKMQYNNRYCDILHSKISVKIIMAKISPTTTLSPKAELTIIQGYAESLALKIQLNVMCEVRLRDQ